MSVERQQISAERVARNDARFREANEQLQEAAESLGFEPDARTPYLCECADLGCTTVLQLTAVEYESVRRSPVLFINAHGHERTAQGWARVVEEHEQTLAAAERWGYMRANPAKLMGPNRQPPPRPIRAYTLA